MSMARGRAWTALGAGLTNIGRFAAEQQDHDEELRRQAAATELRTTQYLTEHGGGRGSIPMTPGTPAMQSTTLESAASPSQMTNAGAGVVPEYETVRPAVAPAPDPRFAAIPEAGGYVLRPDFTPSAIAATERTRRENESLDSNRRYTEARTRELEAQAALENARAHRVGHPGPPSPAARRADEIKALGTVERQIDDTRADLGRAETIAKTATVRPPYMTPDRAAAFPGDSAAAMNRVTSLQARADSLDRVRDPLAAAVQSPLSAIGQVAGGVVQPAGAQRVITQDQADYLRAIGQWDPSRYRVR